MKKFTKVLMVVAPVFVLAACSNSGSTSTSNTASSINVEQSTTFGNMTVRDLQQHYNTVYFLLDSYQISDEYKQILDAHSLLLNKNPDSKVIIEGHADERGTPEYNIALGQRRADAVKQYLESKGVASTQLSTLSYGEEKPAVLGHSEADYAKNRRAVLAY